MASQHEQRSSSKHIDFLSLIDTIAIYPPIGIARVGNSPKEFYYASEVPEQLLTPEGGFKDKEKRVKCQVWCRLPKQLSQKHLQANLSLYK